jgi:hypothetical protein
LVNYQSPLYILFTLTYALPRIRFTFVPQTGQIPCAMRRPESETFTCPSKERFSLHLTQ